MYNDYKTAEDRIGKASTNDWIGMFFAILAGLCVAFIVIEHIIGVEGLAELIS